MKPWQLHIKNYLSSSFNWRIAIAFTAGLVASALFMDFELIAEFARKHIITIELGNLLSSLTGGIVKLFGYDITIVENAIWFNTNNGVYFDFGCLGYRELIWFSIFILIAPGPIKHKLWYIPLGILILEISNILRAASIAISNYHSPQSFELIHAQGTLWFVYGTLLVLWLLWLHYLRK